MKEVVVDAVLDVPSNKVEQKLSPTSIIEYTGAFSVQSREESNGHVIVTAEMDDIEMVVKFTELENGYEYSQQGDKGPFTEMNTTLTIQGEDKTRITIQSEYTFGGLFSFLLDRLASAHRRRELELLITNLALELEEDIKNN